MRNTMRGRKDRHERITKVFKAAYSRSRRREKRRTAKKLASPVCSICMQKLDNSKGPDQYQTKVDDIQENVSSDIVTTSTSMP
ncbi:unnamed protein product [Arabidopsis lyrata]|nr:unnamed protein product [Arabidopsis lyrata]